MKNFLVLFTALLFISCDGNAQKKNPKGETSFSVSKTENEWRQVLTSQQYDVLRNGATERAHSSELNRVNVPGTFVCAACGNELYKTRHKFESGTGWPSFDRPVNGSVAYGANSKYGFEPNEVHCADCGGHLGHVFNDGPKRTTGKRHCINGVAMKFIPDEAGE